MSVGTPATEIDRIACRMRMLMHYGIQRVSSMHFNPCAIIRMHYGMRQSSAHRFTSTADSGGAQQSDALSPRQLP